MSDMREVSVKRQWRQKATVKVATVKVIHRSPFTRGGRPTHIGVREQR